MKRLIAAILSASLATGAGLGLLVPSSRASGVTTAIYYYAGVDYGTSQLTCGWHSACEGNPNYERGLDWISTQSPWYSTDAARFNAWGLSPDLSPTARAHAVIGNIRSPEQTNCPSTSVSIYDQNWILQVRVYDMHSEPGSYNGGGFPIYARLCTEHLIRWLLE